jgi:hypothetical protein
MPAFPDAIAFQIPLKIHTVREGVTVLHVPLNHFGFWQGVSLTPYFVSHFCGKFPLLLHKIILRKRVRRF